MSQQQLNQQLFQYFQEENLERIKQLVDQGAQISEARILNTNGDVNNIYDYNYGIYFPFIQNNRDIVKYVLEKLVSQGEIIVGQNIIPRYVLIAVYYQGHINNRSRNEELQDSVRDYLSFGTEILSNEQQLEQEEVATVLYEQPDENQMIIEDEQLNLMRDVFEVLGVSSFMESLTRRRYENNTDLICKLGQDVITLESFDNKLLSTFEESENIIGFIIIKNHRKNFVLCSIKDQLERYWDGKKDIYKGVVASNNQEYINKKNDRRNDMYFMNFDQLPGTFFLLNNALIVIESQEKIFAVLKTDKKWYDTNSGMSVYHNSYRDGDYIHIIIPIK